MSKFDELARTEETVMLDQYGIQLPSGRIIWGDPQNRSMVSLDQHVTGRQTQGYWIDPGYPSDNFSGLQDLYAQQLRATGLDEDNIPQLVRVKRHFIAVVTPPEVVN